MAASINASTSAGVVTTADTSGNLNLQSNGTTIVALTSAGAAVTGTLSASGKITATTAGIDVPTSALGTCYSGTYTPTLTNGSNVASSNPFICQYMRVGNVVTVSGFLTLDPTSSGTYTSIEISLPIASDFTATSQCGGTGSTGLSTVSAFGILAGVTNNTAQMDGTMGVTSNEAVRFSFTYLIV
jgi:hypothetical protein